MRVLELAEDGSKLKMWVSGAMDFHNDNLWHPKSLLDEIVSNVCYPQPICMAGSSDEQLISKCARANWDRAANWNAKSLKYMMRNGGYSVIFSHFHNIDLQGHLLVKFLKNGSNKMEAETYNKLFRDVYVQTDCYIGEFLEMLDDLSEETGLKTSDAILEKVASMSCKAAVKGNQRLSLAEMDHLIGELLECENPYQCPHGRPTIISMTKYELEKKFKRIV